MRVKILHNFIIGNNHLGKAVFAGRAFVPNDVVVKFEGKIVDSSKLPTKLEGVHDRYVQVGINNYMGPSGDVDDFINHSCDPNTGLKFSPLGIILIAIKDIAVGDEITWDYSTTLLENPWKMLCDCKSKKCRKIISDFALLDSTTQKYYYDLEIIAPCIKEYMDSPSYLVYTRGIESQKSHDK